MSEDTTDYTYIRSNLPNGQEVSVRIPMRVYDRREQSAVSNDAAHKLSRWFQKWAICLPLLSMVVGAMQITPWPLISLGLAASAMMIIHAVRSCYHTMQVRKIDHYVQLKISNGEYQKVNRHEGGLDPFDGF